MTDTMEKIHVSMVGTFDSRFPMKNKTLKWEYDYEAPDAIGIIEEESDAYIKDMAKMLLWGVGDGEGMILDLDRLEKMKETSTHVTGVSGEPIGYIASITSMCDLQESSHRSKIGTATLVTSFVVTL